METCLSAAAPYAERMGGKTGHGRPVEHGRASVPGIGHRGDVESAGELSLQVDVHRARRGRAGDHHLGVVRLRSVQRGGETEQEAQEEGRGKPGSFRERSDRLDPGRLLC